MTDSELFSRYPDVPSIQLELVKAAYGIWQPINWYCRAAKKPEPRTLPEVVKDILPLFRQGATIYLDNPRYRALGELILEAIADADPAALVKKFKTKAEKAQKAQKAERD